MNAQDVIGRKALRWVEVRSGICGMLLACGLCLTNAAAVETPTVATSEPTAPASPQNGQSAAQDPALADEKAPVESPEIAVDSYQGQLIKANAGDTQAQLKLGQMRRDGKGVEKDLAKARAWLGRAAVGGNAQAMHELSLLLMSDQLPQSKTREADALVKEGLVWLSRSASKAYPPAVKALGLTLLTLPDRQTDALGWIEACALQMDVDCSVLMADHFFSLLKKATAEDKPRMAEYALRFTEIAAKAGHAPSMNNLGSFYSEGIGVRPNLDLAASWYRQAAAKNDPNGQYNLGLLFLQNRVQPLKSDASVLELLTASAQAGHVQAQRTLADVLSDGKRYPKQPAQAAQWYAKAAEQGDPVAQYKLGVVYQQGIGLERNLESAYQWLSRSAEQNYIPALYGRGVALTMGLGASTDIPTGVSLIERAAAKGYNPAKAWMAAEAAKYTPAVPSQSRPLAPPQAPAVTDTAPSAQPEKESLSPPAEAQTSAPLVPTKP